MARFTYYPGHMAKTKRKLKEKLRWADIVFELLDARAPISSRNRDLDDILKGKPRIVLLNKADLAEERELDRFVAHFETQGLPTLKMNAHSQRHTKEIVPLAEQVLADKFEKELEKGRRKRPIRALIVGIPNVGKSTLINQLVSKKVANVGDRPNITKDLQVIRIHENLELIDTPGLLWPNLDDETVGLKLGLLGALKDHMVPRDEVVIYGFKVLSEHYREAFEQRYDLEVGDFDVLDLFEKIGKRLGSLKKGGEVDYEKVMDRFLHDFRHQRFGRIILDRVADA